MAIKNSINVGGGGETLDIPSLAEKTTPVGNDEIVIVDSEDSNTNKKVKLTNLPATGDGLPFAAAPSITSGNSFILTMSDFVTVYDVAPEYSEFQIYNDVGLTTLAGESGDLPYGGPFNASSILSEGTYYAIGRHKTTVYGVEKTTSWAATQEIIVPESVIYEAQAVFANNDDSLIENPPETATQNPAFAYNCLNWTRQQLIDVVNGKQATMGTQLIKDGITNYTFHVYDGLTTTSARKIYIDLGAKCECNKVYFQGVTSDTYGGWSYSYTNGVVFEYWDDVSLTWEYAAKVPSILDASVDMENTVFEYFIRPVQARYFRVNKPNSNYQQTRRFQPAFVIDPTSLIPVSEMSIDSSSGHYSDRVESRIIDNSGLPAPQDEYTIYEGNPITDDWLCQSTTNVWVKIAFNNVYDIDTLIFWNGGSDIAARGWLSFNIEFYDESNTLIETKTNFKVESGTNGGQPQPLYFTIVEGVKYVKLVMTQNRGDSTYSSVAEVKFKGIIS